MTVITSTDFLNQLANPSMPAGTHQVNVSGCPVWFRVYRRPGTKVVFTFQGTIDRDDTPVPVYGTDLSDDIPNATIVGISDPALDVFPAPLGSGWYAGWEGVNLQAKLGAFFPQIVSALGATRVIFQGSSAGGFAALYYGSLIPYSIIIPLNPQTNLDAYHSTENYRNACWGGYTGSLASKITASVLPYFSTTTFTQSIVYVINEGDAHQFDSHYLPLLQAMPDSKQWRVIDRTVGIGIPEHVGLDEDIWVPVVQAAVNVIDPTTPTPRKANANEIRAAMRW